MRILSCLKYSLGAAIAAIGILSTASSVTAAPLFPAQASASAANHNPAILPIRDDRDGYGRYDDDDEDDYDDDYYDDVDAPTTHVRRRGRDVEVDAPFTSVDRSRDGVHVRAPFVDLWVPRY